MSELLDPTQPVDLSNCDREPIHIPGSIQPHGLMLVVEPDTMAVSHAAGNAEDWLGRPDRIGSEAAAAVLQLFRATEPRMGRLTVPSPTGPLDATAFASGTRLVIEL